MTSAPAVHPVASSGFGAEAEAYERARPSYPPDAVAWVVDSLRIDARSTVVDLAAGTGKFTRLLEPTGARILAVEPVRAMRAQLRRHDAERPGHPVQIAAATAEALPLRDATVDAVTVAQAFHWFDAPRAFAELRRVVRRGGRVALVWNARDRTRDWVDAVWQVMDRVEKRAPWRDHNDGTGGPDGATRWSEREFDGGEGWTPFVTHSVVHEHRCTPDDVVDRMRSVSHVATLAPADQTAVLDEVRTILATHADTAGHATLAIPYRVDLMFTERT